MQLAGGRAAAALVLVEARKPVEKVLQRADLGRRERAGFERGQRQVADLGAGVAVRQGGRVVGADPVVNPDSEARWVLTVAGARPSPPASRAVVRCVTGSLSRFGCWDASWRVPTSSG